MINRIAFNAAIGTATIKAMEAAFAGDYRAAFLWWWAGCFIGSAGWITEEIEKLERAEV